MKVIVRFKDSFTGEIRPSVELEFTHRPMRGELFTTGYDEQYGDAVLFEVLYVVHETGYDMPITVYAAYVGDGTTLGLHFKNAKVAQIEHGEAIDFAGEINIGMFIKSHGTSSSGDRKTSTNLT